MSVPLVRTPLPASAVHQNAFPAATHSLDCCAPYLPIENPHRFIRSFGAQPMVGIVITTSAPCARDSCTNRSAEEPLGRFWGAGLSSGMLKKNQSLPVLCVSYVHA